MVTVVGRGTEVPEKKARLVFDQSLNESIRLNVLQIRDALETACGAAVEVCDNTAGEGVFGCDIIVGLAEQRKNAVKAYEELGNDEYIIRYCPGDAGAELIVAYRGTAARLCAIDRLIDEYVSGEGLIVPEGLDIKGKCTFDGTTSAGQLRDPFLLNESGTYYLYGSGWQYYKNTSGKLFGDWKGPFSCVSVPSDAVDCHWAPEVHKYKGSYYMITTYKSGKTGHRGCTVLKSATPEGPFAEISDGHVTPEDWDSIDGTLYVDEEGQPWLVFVHEWTSTDDGVGRMAAARLSHDLSHTVSEPAELFNALSPEWAKNKVTDGCFMYKASDGKLWMLWSNWDGDGYCIGMAYSADGTVTGEWKQEKRRLYSKGLGFAYDGGHGMLFRDTDGRLYVSFHSPNSTSAGRAETPVFIPVAEQYSKLVPDFWEKT